MKKRTKIILGSILAVVLFGSFVIAAINRITGIRFLLQQANAEGSEYGKTTDHNGCMEKGYTLSVSATGVDLTAEEFVRGCLNTSRASTGFCEGVTSVLDREYFKAQCKKVRHETDACEESFLAKRNFCRMSEKN